MSRALRDGVGHDKRLRALCETRIAFYREYSGLHEYDGVVQDLSPAGIRSALTRLGGEAYSDTLDEEAVLAAEQGVRVRLGEMEYLRREPGLHLENLDVACYDRAYAPEEDRRSARLRHLKAWPEAVAASLETLDMVSSDVARAMLGSARGLAASVTEADGSEGAVALQALSRFVSYLEAVAQAGRPTAPLGSQALTRLLGSADGLTLDLKRVQETIKDERTRIREILRDGLGRLGIRTEDREALRMLSRPVSDFGAVLASARNLVRDAQSFVTSRRLIPWTEGDCLVAPTPAGRRWAVARVSWCAPCEPLTPAQFHLTPPDPAWSADQQRAWLSRFSGLTLPATTVHETVPGHAAHAIAMRHAKTLPRRVIWSELFFEGWAHYVEEMCWEEGFRSGDARFQVGMALESLVRLARVDVAVGLHTGQLTLSEAERVFRKEAYLEGVAASAEAQRGLFEPTYVRYTLGKVLVRRMREQLRARRGAGYSNADFHAELLGLGSPGVGPAARALGLEPGALM